MGFVRIISILCMYYLVTVNSEVDFVDCGSSFEILSVSVSNCSYFNCSFKPDDSLFVDIVTKPVLATLVTSMATKSYLVQNGQRWEVTVTPMDPCTVWRCPVQISTVLTYSMKVQLSNVFLRRPANVIIESALTNTWAICLSFDIEII